MVLLCVVSMMGMVNDFVKCVGGDVIMVDVLMGLGVDLYLYKVIVVDVLKLNCVDVVFYNGLLLEGKMIDVFIWMVRFGKCVYVIMEKFFFVWFLKLEDYEGYFDLYVWFDVELWVECVLVIVVCLSEVVLE